MQRFLLGVDATPEQEFPWTMNIAGRPGFKAGSAVAAKVTVPEQDVLMLRAEGVTVHAPDVVMLQAEGVGRVSTEMAPINGRYSSI